MDIMQESEIQKIKELLTHTAEFIAYFELIEEKMLVWREELAQQNLLVEKKIALIQQELQTTYQVLTEAGVANFKNEVALALKVGAKHLDALENHQRLSQRAHLEQQQEMQQQINHFLTVINEYTTQSIKQIEQHWLAYDAHQFNRIANESVVHVEKAANKALKKCNYLVRSFNWRSCIFSLLTAVSASLVLGLYLGNELPWELHESAKSEREAGRILLRAWPVLSKQEQYKIIFLSSSNTLK